MLVLQGRRSSLLLMLVWLDDFDIDIVCCVYSDVVLFTDCCCGTVTAAHTAITLTCPPTSKHGP